MDLIEPWQVCIRYLIELLQNTYHLSNVCGSTAVRGLSENGYIYSSFQPVCSVLAQFSSIRDRWHIYLQMTHLLAVLWNHMWAWSPRDGMLHKIGQVNGPGMFISLRFRSIQRNMITIKTNAIAIKTWVCWDCDRSWLKYSEGLCILFLMDALNVFQSIPNMTASISQIYYLSVLLLTFVYFTLPKHNMFSVWKPYASANVFDLQKFCK